MNEFDVLVILWNGLFKNIRQSMKS